MKSLVLIPGLLCNQALWRGQIAGLGECAHIVVADVTGHGTIPAMAAAVLERAPERFSLAGFSLGSQVALEIMRLADDRIERLALLSATRGGVSPPVRKTLRRAMAMIEQGCFYEYLEAAYPTYVSPARVHDVALKRSFIDMALAVGPEAGLLQMQALLTIAGPFRGLGRIDCSTVIIGGREDHRTTPAAHEALAAAILGSTLVTIGDAAHFTPLEQPDKVTDVLRSWITGSISDGAAIGNPL